MKYYPIKTPNDDPYITIVDNEDNTFCFKIDRYKNVLVWCDKRAIPDMIKILTEIQNENIHK